MTDKIKHYPGTSLSEKDFADGKILFNHDELKAEFAWDTGIGIGSYLAGLKRGVILGSRCNHCRVKSSIKREDLAGCFKRPIPYSLLTKFICWLAQEVQTALLMQQIF